MQELQNIVNALIEFYNKDIVGNLIKLVGNNAGIVEFLQKLLLKAVDFAK